MATMNIKMTTSHKSFHCQICNAVRQHKIVYLVQGYPICKCEVCGVGRVDVENFDPKDYYNNGYFTGEYEHSYVDYIGSKKILSEEFAKTVEFIRDIGPADGTLLEVGCAYGLFLQQAKHHFQVYGVELVPAAAAFCKESGLTDVKHGVLVKDDLEKIGVLDAAVMLDVIEHIDNVAETVGMIAEHLRPGGSFTITTGDWGSFVARITGSRWRLMAPPLHLWYFTPSSLARLGEQFGLKLISCSHPWKIVPLELILQQASTMIGLHIKVSLPKPFKNFGLPVSLGDAVRVVFRKAG